MRIGFLQLWISLRDAISFRIILYLLCWTFHYLFAITLCALNQTGKTCLSNHQNLSKIHFVVVFACHSFISSLQTSLLSLLARNGDNQNCYQFPTSNHAGNDYSHKYSSRASARSVAQYHHLNWFPVGGSRTNYSGIDLVQHGRWRRRHGYIIIGAFDAIN